MSPLNGSPRLAPSPEAMERALNKARRERSLAFWTMLQAIFGRPDARETAETIASRAPGRAGLCAAGH